MRVTGEAGHEGVAERSFVADGPAEPVPGVLWVPAGATGPRPLVLLGHGGGQHKRSSNVTRLACRLVTRHGVAAVAIDQAHHGERMPPEERDLSRAGHQRLLRRRMTAEGGHHRAVEQAVGDWVATLDAVQGLDDVGTGPVGYWGLSMGTRFGIPLVAAEPRIVTAVLGLFGWAPGPRLAGLDEMARKVAVPLLFLLQWDDELAGRRYALDLFGLFPGPAKTLHANPGGHFELPATEVDATEEFLARHLTAATPAATGSERRSLIGYL